MWEFIKYLFLADIGRLCLGAVIMFLGGILLNEFNYKPMFYIGLAIFALEFAWLFLNMIYQVVIKGWLGL